MPPEKSPSRSSEASNPKKRRGDNPTGAELARAIDELLAHVEKLYGLFYELDGRTVRDSLELPIGSDWHERFEQLDVAVWIEAHSVGLSDELPRCPTPTLGKTGLPCRVTSVIEPCSGEIVHWRTGMLALRELAKSLKRKSDAPHPSEADGDNHVQQSAPLPPSAPPLPPHPKNAIHKKGDYWTLRFGSETGRYNRKCPEWLAKLLGSPNRSFSVAELLGDPDGRLAADAALGSETAGDAQWIKRLRNELSDVEEAIKDTGGTEASFDKKKELLDQLKEARKRIPDSLRKAHRNIATQFRSFIRDTLTADMPQLAAHLKSSLAMDLPNFAYRPPLDSQFWEN
jgi:hypothetical protein